MNFYKIYKLLNKNKQSKTKYLTTNFKYFKNSYALIIISNIKI